MKIILPFSIIFFFIICSCKCLAGQAVQNQTVYNTTIATLAQDIAQQIEIINAQVEKLSPKCFVTLAIIGCILTPTIGILIKIIMMHSYKKLILRPSNYENQRLHQGTSLC